MAHRGDRTAMRPLLRILYPLRRTRIAVLGARRAPRRDCRARQALCRAGAPNARFPSRGRWRPRPSQRWLCGPPSADRRGGDGKGRALGWFGLIVLGAATLSACVSTTAMRNGRFAEQGRDYDRAVVEYTRALREHPNDGNVRQALERMKLRAAQEHFTRARRLASSGNLDEAL